MIAHPELPAKFLYRQNLSRGQHLFLIQLSLNIYPFMQVNISSSFLFLASFCMSISAISTVYYQHNIHVKNPPHKILSNIKIFLCYLTKIFRQMFGVSKVCPDLKKIASECYSMHLFTNYILRLCLPTQYNTLTNKQI